jgi:hypothetical protein
MSIKKSIKSNIQELQERKKKNLIETKIVKNRFNIISEGVNLKSKIKTKNLLDSLLSECNYLKNQGFSDKVINEGFLEVMGDLFGQEGPQFWDTVKNRLSEYLTSKFNIDGWMKDKIIEGIGNVEMDEIPLLFTDCRFLVKKVTDAAMEGFNESLEVQGADNTVPGIFRNSLDNILSSDDYRRKLEDSFTTIVCPAMGQISKNMEDKLEDMKRSMFS